MAESIGAGGTGGTRSDPNAMGDTGRFDGDRSTASGPGGPGGTSDSTSMESLASQPTAAEALIRSPTTADTLSGHDCAVPESPGDEAAVDDFHACASGVDSRATIDRAQARTADGGCAALSDTAMLCNPVGLEIGEFVVGRPAGFPAYVGPHAGFDHAYTARASTPGGWPALAEQMNARLQENPTPGNDLQATPRGVVNDAGIMPIADTDLVRSSVSTDVQGRSIVSNVTIPGQHVLDPGIVSQTAWSDGRYTHAVAVGEGNGALSVPANVIAEQVFEGKLEADFRVAITRDTAR